jgi:hypothetical protein
MQRTTFGGAFVAATLCIAVPARAGVVIAGESAHSGPDGKTQKSTTTTRIEGSRQRVDAEHAITLVDVDKGTMRILDVASKTYREYSLKDGPMAMGVAMMEKMKFTPKGTHQTIAGLTCDDYAVDMGFGQQLQCVAKSGPGMDEYKAFTHKFIRAFGVKLPAGAPEGYVVDMQTSMGPTTLRTTVTSVRTASIPASTFDIPAGYTKSTGPDPMEMMERTQPGKPPSK